MPGPAKWFNLTRGLWSVASKTTPVGNLAEIVSPSHLAVSLNFVVTVALSSLMSVMSAE